MNSTTPNRHGPCRKPYADPSKQEAAKAKTSIAVTANKPKAVTDFIFVDWSVAETHGEILVAALDSRHRGELLVFEGLF